MKNEKKRKGAKKTPPERKNLSVTNHGDLVIIRNRSTVAAGVLGGIILSLSLVCLLAFKDAWELPLFWTAFALLIFGVLYSFANMIFGKITLDSPNMLINVYNPIKIQYKFKDVNYVDLQTSKDSNGAKIYKILIYIGKGKRSVEIVSYSGEQARALEALLRGMLDNGAMTYPEGDDEPFSYNDEEEERFNFLKRRKRPEFESKENAENKPSFKTEKSEDIPEGKAEYKENEQNIHEDENN